MKRNIFLFFIASAMLILISCSSRISGSKTGSSIKISSVPLNVPVIKGLSANPVICITIEVPVGAEASYSKINCTLDANAVGTIQKLDIYYTDTIKKFSDKNLVGSLTQLSAETAIPINIKLKPGLNYVWLSAVLLPVADIDKKIELSISSLTDGNNKQRVQQSDLSYIRRLGIAVRKAGDDGVHTYRIPGMTMTSKGTLIAVYDIRYNNSRDLPNNIDIGMSRSTDSGKTWEPMKKIIDMGEPNENNGIGDPAILFDPSTNKIWVTALWSKGNRSIAGSKPGLSPDTTGQFVMAVSDDDGVSWSAPNSITAQVKNPAWHLYFNGPGNGIVMQNGTLVFPSQYWDENKVPHSAIIYSKDHGNTWSTGVGAKSNTTESQVIETSPGTLMLSMRDNRGKFRSIASTTDMGSHWVEHPTSTNTLPDPIWMASLMKADVKAAGSQKQVLFFSNPASSDRSLRDSMTVRASFDMGNTWPDKDRVLIDERNFFGYSVLVRINENMLGLLYEGISELYFVRIPVSEILK